ncbi:MAG: SAM-dependent methyltransferase [Candidatus Paceibacterota bacterium]
MIKFIRNNILKKIYYLLINIYKVNQIILKQYGYLKTIRFGLPVNQKGEPIPWYTYPAIEYIDQLDLSEKNIFEYGSGHSSLFFAKKAKSVTSVEEDKEWFEKISKNKPENLNILYKKEKNDYVSSITKFNKKFDLIIIDANYRIECCSVAKDYLNDGGIIILDNSDRDNDSAIYLRNIPNLIEVNFSGFGPINGYTWTTSLFFSRNYNIQMINKSQSQKSIGEAK